MSFTIELKKRSAGAADAVRAEGFVPAVVYGRGTEPTSVSVPASVFSALYRDAGTSTLIDITVDGGSPVKGLIQDVQYDPLKGKPIHVDFRLIDMNKEMEIAIELTFVGEAPAAKELGGTFVAGAQTINIKCLPKDLVNHITVDVSSLKTFADVIHVSDLVLPQGITAVDSADMVVAKVLAPLTEEELKAMEAAAAPDISQIEVEKKGKEETAEEGAGEAEAKKE